MTSIATRFRDGRTGNVAIIFALSLPLIISVVGMSTDYTLAGRRESQISAIADAAALSTTTPAAMGLAPAVAQANAVKMFNAQMAMVTGVTYNADVSITVTDTSGTSNKRSTTVTWSATSTNAFSSMLKMPTTRIGGTSKAFNATAPNIDFYMFLDTSPSMGIPSSQAGIDTLVQNTSAQGGCAFACHETNPKASDNAGNPNGEDNYALARALNLTLRIDLVQQAAANLFATAQSTEASNKAVYRVATYTFDQSLQAITNLTADLNQAQSDAINKIKMLTVYSASKLTAATNNNDEDTQWDQAMANSVYIPNPGNGTNTSGDTPQAMLFIVTDGVVDEAYPGYGNTNMTVSGRTITMPNYQQDYCSALKSRGIRIAVLYTTYLPLPSNAFYNMHVDPFQPQIPTALTNCASPGLFFQVDTGGDINGAMQALFAKAVTTAHLTQ